MRSLRQQIDIAAHRPHPPGYLGYVAVARALDSVTGNINDALVLWNIIATALAAMLLVRFAWELAEDDPRRTAFAAGAGALMIFSPLFWFYGEIAEIYPSETLAAVVLAYLAWRASRGEPRAPYLSALAIPLAAAFKLTLAVLMLPVIVYGGRRLPETTRLKAGFLFLACATAVGVAFFLVAPDLGGLIWQHFVTSTAASRLGAMPAEDVLERLNHNFRDTLTAAVSMVGVVNVFGMVWWLARDRRLPPGIDRTFAACWTLPWVLLCTVVHIGKPGYVLPLLPLTSLVLASFYARRSRALCTVLLLVQASVNVAHFVAVGPFPETVTGGTRQYRAKTFFQKVASDLQPLTESTAATVRHSDVRMARILAELDRCRSSRPVIVAGGETRRLMWYVPNAIVIYVADGRVQNVAIDGVFTPVIDEARVFAVSCPVLWVLDGGSPELPVPDGSSTPLTDVGLSIDASQVRVTRSSIEFD